MIETTERPESESDSPRKFEIAGGQDLPDSPHDEERMQPEETIIEMPDVKDIPGQEHVRPPALGMLADTTISSDDEEGVGIFDDETDSADEDGIGEDTSANVTGDERRALQQADEDMPTDDDNNLRRAALDNEDEDGELLNEKGFGEDVSGADIDVPGAETDDLNEDIGEEDEENNAYSVPDNDDSNESNQ